MRLIFLKYKLLAVEAYKMPVVFFQQYKNPAYCTRSNWNAIKILSSGA